MLDSLVLKNAVECTSQRLKWTSGARPAGGRGGRGRGAGAVGLAVLNMLYRDLK